MARTYIVRIVTHGRTGHNAVSEHRVTATSPSEALTMVERQGFDYHEAEISDEANNQLAVYGANLWREEFEDDTMCMCPNCGVEMLYWQRGDHECSNA